MKLNLKKRHKLFMSIGVFMFAFSCSDDVFKETQDTNQTFVERNAQKNEKWQIKEEFGFALSSAVNQSFELRQMLKEEALKMFNKDYEVLVYLIKDVRLENNLTFEDLINSHLGENQTLQRILNVEPTLTILVPELPMDSFSAEKWNVESEIPAVAIRTNVTNEVPLITPDGELEIMPADVTPGFPVVVVKNNERLVSNIENSDIDKYYTRAVYDKNGVVIKFWANSFDNEIRNESNTQQRMTNYLDPVITHAYDIYEQQHPNLNGWQRDYIYYGIEPSNPNGPFIYDFKEHIRSFGMTGNAMAAYNAISGHTGDPELKTYDHRINTSHWTGGGFYEFKVRTIINAKNGVGNELINGFSLSPDDLFDVEYEEYSTGKWFWKKRYYRFKSISLKPPVLVDLPLINWDLDQYSTSIKIDIEEVDIPTTTAITETTNSKFAQNFELSAELPIKMIKIGLKLGSSSENTKNVTIKKTYTQGNDKLGEVVVNFADKVIVKKRKKSIIRKTWETREYSTGNCRFSVEPKRVQ